MGKRSLLIRVASMLVLAAGVPTAWLDTAEGVGVKGLRTAYGSLTYGLRKQGRDYVLTLVPGVTPPGGFVLQWPRGEGDGAVGVFAQLLAAQRHRLAQRVALGQRGVQVGYELGRSHHVDVVPHGDHAGNARVDHFLGQRTERADLRVHLVR